MKIRQLNKEEYAGRKFTAYYQTQGYYDICSFEQGFYLTYKSFETTIEKSFEDTFFGEWLENPIAFGAFYGDRLVGFAEGALESWNNRFRISNICVFDVSERGRGTGTMLMNKILKEAEAFKPRMIVLETQTCNEKAIKFYKKNGFDIIGFDLYSYSNNDPERREIRIELGRNNEI